MRIIPRVNNPLVPVLLAGLVPAGLGCLLAGCSSSVYDADLAARVAAYANAAEFSKLLSQPTKLAGGRLEVRVPRLFDTQLDGKEQSARSKPPFVREFPGFERGFEKLIDAGGGKRMAAVLTLGSVPAAEQKREDIEALVLKQVQGEESFSKAVWQRGRDLVDEHGETRKWDVLELKGRQPFDRIGSDNKAESTRSEGNCQIWVSAEPKQEHCVVLAWRVPSELAAAVPVGELAQLVARTLAHLPAESPPAAGAAAPASSLVIATSAGPARRPVEPAAAAGPRRRSTD